VGRGLLGRLGRAGRGGQKIIALILLPALLVSGIDLVRLVQGIYPVVGWLSLVLWAALFIRTLRALGAGLM